MNDGAAGAEKLYRLDRGRVFDRNFDSGSLRAVRTVVVVSIGLICMAALGSSFTFFGLGLVPVEIPHVVNAGLAVLSGALGLIWAGTTSARTVMKMPYAIAVFGGLVFAYGIFRLVQVIICVNNPEDIGSSRLCEESLTWEIAGMVVFLVVGFGELVIIANTFAVREAIKSAQNKFAQAAQKKRESGESSDIDFDSDSGNLSMPLLEEAMTARSTGSEQKDSLLRKRSRE
jgi:hypothetical protein